MKPRLPVFAAAAFFGAWSRPFRETMFLPVGAADQFDTARIWSNATPVVLDDEIRFYYGGAENPWTFGKGEKLWGSKKRMPKTGIGLTTLNAANDEPIAPR